MLRMLGFTLLGLLVVAGLAVLVGYGLVRFLAWLLRDVPIDLD